MATSTLSEYSNPTELLGVLSHQNGSGKSNLAATKPEALISPLVDTIGTRFQRLVLHYVFGFQQSDKTSGNDVEPNMKRPEV